jgi:hypothetical protein
MFCPGSGTKRAQPRTQGSKIGPHIAARPLPISTKADPYIRRLHAHPPKEMKPFSRGQEKALLALAIFGLIVPSGVFLYFSLIDATALHKALINPIALVFMTEAFLLMLLFAWLIRWVCVRPGGWSS